MFKKVAVLAMFFWLCSVSVFHYLAVSKQQEIDIAFKSVQLQIMAQQVHCESASNP